jgi:pimeloyl-ACP methyl ester carboxylesterase
MRVEQYGSGSPAMIFIPGLACGAWIWDDTVSVYAKTHTVYVVTLAGVDGVPSVTGSPLDAADASLLELITDRKIDRPVIVGHSLGGYLALRFGTEHSQLVRGIVSVDGTPILPMLVQMTPDQRTSAADQMASQLAGMNQTQFAAGQQAFLPTMITDPGKAAQVAALTGKEDPIATSRYARDIYSADLRAQLKSLTAPTLEIAPVPTKPASFEPPEMAKAPMSDRMAAYQQFYETLFPGVSNVSVVPIANSKHFVMVDQPQALEDAITSFMGKLPA